MPETPNLDSISTKRRRIAMLAQRSPKMAFTSLAHYMDMDWLWEAWRRTRKDGAVGVDRQTADDYAVNLESNLQSLLHRAKSGRYQAPPVRRVHIPKAGSTTETRPLGVPTFEDKVLQRAVAMLVEEVYEQDFYDGSYRFRPGRSAHQALAALWRQLMDMNGAWVLEIDIRKFFDCLDHGHLRTILSQRVRDGVLLRLIGKWLNAGVIEDGRLQRSESGSPQGGVISPVLANVYLHEVLDTWFEREVQPRMKGPAHLIRYADDAVLVFQREDDARRVMDVIAKRFARYGLTLHPNKTRLTRFLRPRLRAARDARTGTFDLLGFTHYWGRSQKGAWVVKRKTSKSRYCRALKSISDWCRQHRHMPIEQQCELLGQKLRGHYAYYGIPGNSRCLQRFEFAVDRVWYKWLCRRSDKARMPWEQYQRLRQRYMLPSAVLPRGRKSRSELMS